MNLIRVASGGAVMAQNEKVIEGQVVGGPNKWEIIQCHYGDERAPDVYFTFHQGLEKVPFPPGMDFVHSEISMQILSATRGLTRTMDWEFVGIGFHPKTKQQVKIQVVKYDFRKRMGKITIYDHQ